MKNVYYLLALLLIMSAGCRHENCKEAACNMGRVIDAITGEGVPNAKVNLYFNEGSSSWMTMMKYIKSVTADERGYYYLTIDSLSNEGTYAVSAKQPNYYFDDDVVPIPSYSGTNLNVNLKMQPKGWLKMHIKNVNPEDGNDDIRINYANIELVGENIDTSIVLDLRAGTETYLTCFLYKSSKGEYRLHLDPDIPINDTASLEILY